MRQVKTADNVSHTQIQGRKDWSSTCLIKGEKKGLLKRLAENQTVRGALAVLALNVGVAVAFPGYLHSLEWALLKAKDNLRYSLVEREKYVVKENDKMWDFAGREVEGTYDSDKHLHHQRNLERHLIRYNLNRGMEGINPDGTLNTGKKIYLKDIDGDGNAGF
jgi:hypothetical protein